MVMGPGFRRTGTIDVQASRLQPFDDGYVGHATAFAHGLQAITFVALLQRMQQSRHQLGAASTERMAERDRAAVDVEPRGRGKGLTGISAVGNRSNVLSDRKQGSRPRLLER